MKYFLVIDGGGTKTTAVIANQDGKIVSSGFSGPSNALFLTKKEALSNALTSLEMALSKAKIEKEKIVFGYLYIPGFRECLEEFINISGINCKIENEIETIRYSALNEKDGIAVLAGTGSFAVLFLGDKTHTLGGWGPYFDDLGSGYYLGNLALKQATKDYDSGLSTELQESIKEHFKISEISQIRSLLKKENFREKIASLSPLICNLATKGNKDAILIVDKTVDELVNLAFRAHEISENKKLPVVLVGGLSNSKIIVEKFRHKIKRKTKNKLIYLESKNDLLDGAIKKTLKDKG